MVSLDSWDTVLEVEAHGYEIDESPGDRFSRVSFFLEDREDCFALDDEPERFIS